MSSMSIVDKKKTKTPPKNGKKQNKLKNPKYQNVN